MIKTIDLTGYTLLDVFGLERKNIDGAYSENKLVDLFVYEWIPWYDCYDVCSRSDYCKFPKQNVSGISDIQCGVAIEAVRNYVHTTFNELEKLSKDQLQGYLDGAYHLTMYVFESELYIGRAMDSRYLNAFKEWSPAFFGQLASLRKHLDSFSASTSIIPSFQTSKGIILVEGESEKAFIDTLKLSHATWFLNLNVEVYQGKSNRGHPKLRLLLQNYNSKGYRPYIQGDADGGAINIFDALIQNNSIIKKENTFVFKYDFETAVPSHITYSVLKALGYLSEISLEDFDRLTSGVSEESILNKVKKLFDINLENEKVAFAQTVAKILNKHSGWNKSEVFMKSELGEFLLFLRKIK